MAKKLDKRFFHCRNLQPNHQPNRSACNMSRSKTASTQCNMFLLNPCVQKSKYVQTLKPLKPLRKAAATQAYLNTPNIPVPVLTKDATMQCSLDVRLPYFAKNKETQTGRECKFSIQDLPEVLLRVLSILEEQESFRTCLYYEIRKNRRGEKCLILKHVDNLAISGDDLDPIQVVITESGKCSVFKLFKTAEVTNLVLHGMLMMDELVEVLQQIADPAYVFCPGIKNVNPEFYSTSVTILNYPVLRAQASKCPVWFKRNPSITPGKHKVVRCSHCCNAAKHTSVKMKRKLKETPARVLMRTQTESNYSIRRLSPRNQTARLKSIKRSRRMLREKIAKLEIQISHKKDVLLEDDQSGIAGIAVNSQSECDSVSDAVKCQLSQEFVVKREFESECDTVSE